MILDKLKAKFVKPNHLNKPIAELGLSDRTNNILRRQGMTIVGDLVQLSWNNLRSMRRSNRRLCDEVEKALKGLGLGLRKGDK